MEISILKISGEIAGIGGLILGIFFLMFRSMIEKIGVNYLPASLVYKTTRLLIIFTFLAAIISIIISSEIFKKIITQNNVTLENKLKISKLELIDESTYVSDSKGFGTINSIKPRPSSEFFIKTAPDLQIIILFQIDGYSISETNSISVDGIIKILDATGQKISDAPIGRLSSPSGWRTRPAIEKIGVKLIENKLGLSSIDTNNSPIPYVAISGNFSEGEYPIGDGKIVVEMHDNNAKTKAIDELPIRIRKL